VSEAKQRLRELGHELPEAPAAVATYVPTRLVPLGAGRALLYIAGQVSQREGKLLVGRVPDQVGVEQAREAARACALNVLAQIEAAAGLDQVEQIAQLIGFVNCEDSFGEQPEVINGASDLIVAVLGEAGKHTRAAVGMNALPRGVTVEMTAVVVVRTE
jgi:enamine deaminase RidA (YjgF/YER057c/UK114 family)